MTIDPKHLQARKQAGQTAAPARQSSRETNAMRLCSGFEIRQRVGTPGGLGLRPASAGPAATAPRPAVSAQNTILVVDDHQGVREMFARSLRELGYHVLEAEGPLQAQRLAATPRKIDLLLTDFRMPDMNGVQLARWFHGTVRLCKVLLVSTASGEVKSYLTALDDLVLMQKKEAFGRLAGIVHELLDGMAARSMPADSDCLRRGPSFPANREQFGSFPNHVRLGNGQEPNVRREIP
jgi:CheY-like chemotaxis protein